MITQQKIQQYRQWATARGISQPQIEAEIARKVREDQALTQQNQQQTVQQPPTPTIFPNKTPEKSTVRKVVDFFTSSPQKLGNAIGSAIGERTGVNDQINQSAVGIQSEARKNYDMGVKLRKQGKTKDAERFFRLAEQQGFKATDMLDSRVSEANKQAENAIKGGVGTAAMVLPGGNGFGGKVAMGAIQGAGAGFANSETGKELQGTVGGAVGGAVTAGALDIAGKALDAGRKLVSNTASGLSEKAAMSITKSSPSKFDKIVQEKGIDLNGLVKKYYPAGANYDEVIGAINKKGRGGILGATLEEAEAKIQDTIKTTGKSMKVPADDVVKELGTEVSKLKKIPGNEKNVAALQAFIEETKKLYKNGITPKQLLEIKRAADSKFGQSVVEEGKGTVAAQGQKILANWSRATLKRLFPEVADALETQSEVYTLAPILNKARSIAKTQGSKLRVGSMEGLDITKPATWFTAPVNAALQKPEVASKLLNPGQVSGELTTDSRLLNPLGGKVGGDIAGAGDQTNQVDQVPTDIQQQTSGDMMNGSTVSDQAPVSQRPKNVFGGLSREELLQKAFASGMNQKQLKEIGDIYDTLYPKQKAPTVVAQKEIIKATSSVKALNRLENELIGQNGDLSKVWKSKLPLAPGAQTYRADWGSVIDAIGSFRTGAAYTKEQRSDYNYMLPQVGDPPAVIKQKIQNIREELQGYAQMMQNTSDSGMATQ